jgi:hypothetical protein
VFRDFPGFGHSLSAVLKRDEQKTTMRSSRQTKAAEDRYNESAGEEDRFKTTNSKPAHYFPFS